MRSSCSASSRSRSAVAARRFAGLLLDLGQALLALGDLDLARRERRRPLVQSFCLHVEVGRARVQRGGVSLERRRLRLDLGCARVQCFALRRELLGPRVERCVPARRAERPAPRSRLPAPRAPLPARPAERPAPPPRLPALRSPRPVRRARPRARPARRSASAICSVMSIDCTSVGRRLRIRASRRLPGGRAGLLRGSVRRVDLEPNDAEAPKASASKFSVWRAWWPGAWVCLRRPA